MWIYSKPCIAWLERRLGGPRGEKTEECKRTNMAKARLLIADNNRELSDKLQKFFEECGTVEPCGVAHDGEETLAMIDQLRPDIVLMELLLPRLDGISVLERLNSSPPAHMPHVIVTSFVEQEPVMNRVMSIGASYYIIKPYLMDDVYKRVMMFVEPSSYALPSLGDFRDRLKRALIDLGETPGTRGFAYIIDAAEVLSQEETPCSITKVVYPEVARRHETTADCVESAVRKAISRIYETDNEALRLLTGHSSGIKRLSNRKFLTLLVEKVRDGTLGGAHRDSVGKTPDA